MRPTTILAVLVTVVLLASCGPEVGPADRSGPTRSPTEDRTSGPPASGPSASRTKLTVTVRPSPQARARVWTLTCRPAGGDHPRPRASCRRLAAADKPFAPVPKNTMCTQQYGGPQTATIKGTWHGKRVSASYDRHNGCQIARWNALSTVLSPGPGGTPDSR